MTQKERDRLVVLKKARAGLITQRQAASEVGLTERQVRRLLRRLKDKGDKAVIHGSPAESATARLPTKSGRRQSRY